MTRRSVRGFRDTSVPRHCVENLIELASRAPSGTNIQPWRLYVCAGQVKDALCKALVAAHFAGEEGQEEYRYYPQIWREPYISRRKRLGVALYSSLGIEKGDKEAMSRQHAKNYEFFGAPVGLFITIPRDFPKGAWLDIGMFIQTLLLAARGMGLDTCPQQAFAKFHRIIREHLPISDDEILVCGIALGYADVEAPANLISTEREGISNFATFAGFECGAKHGQ